MQIRANSWLIFPLRPWRLGGSLFPLRCSLFSVVSVCSVFNLFFVHIRVNSWLRFLRALCVLCGFLILGCPLTSFTLSSRRATVFKVKPFRQHMGLARGSEISLSHLKWSAVSSCTLSRLPLVAFPLHADVDRMFGSRD